MNLRKAIVYMKGRLKLTSYNVDGKISHDSFLEVEREALEALLKYTEEKTRKKRSKDV
jgi:hypothetical protein